MTKKFLSFLFVSVFALGTVLGVVGFVGVNKAEAQTVLFPSGCGSALGYSATTGDPCNGTNDATDKYMSGCNNSALGYSATTGEPCSGASIAIQFMAGCTSTIGYSAISGEACNGTNTATVFVLPPVVPGLPSTGLRGNATTNMILLASSMLLVVLGFAYTNLSSKSFKS